MWILGESMRRPQVQGFRCQIRQSCCKLVRIGLVQYIRYVEWLLASRTRSGIYAKNCIVTHLGLHQWKVMPFGLSGAPGTFQKLMQMVLGSMTYNQLFVYLDGVFCAVYFSKSGCGEAQ